MNRGTGYDAINCQWLENLKKREMVMLGTKPGTASFITATAPFKFLFLNNHVHDQMKCCVCD